MPNKPIIKKSFPKSKSWVLMNPEDRKAMRFESLKKLREYADECSLLIKKSHEFEKTYETDFTAR
jgi:hypothetical protein